MPLWNFAARYRTKVPQWHLLVEIFISLMFTSRKLSPKALLGCGRISKRKLGWFGMYNRHSHSHAWARLLKYVSRGRIRIFLTKKDISPSHGITFGLDQTTVIPSSSPWAQVIPTVSRPGFLLYPFQLPSLLPLMNKDWNTSLSIQFRNIYQQYSSGA